MRNQFIIRVRFFVLLLSLLPLGRTVHANEPVIHALLFYSPSCPHCHTVITESLPPIIDKYGDQIQILGINTTTEKGNELYLASVQIFNIPREQQGVPMLIVGDTFLVGSFDIPLLFPDIVAQGLVSGGIDWPDIPGLAQLLEDETITGSDENTADESGVGDNQDPVEDGNIFNTENNQGELEQEQVSQSDQNLTVSSEIGDSFVTSENMTVAERFMQDSTGNSISTLMLIGMIFSVVFAGVIALRSVQIIKPWSNWVIAILMAIGFFVAVYMAYVEISQSEAVCGPVGDCNTVQQSPYASLFGLIPIGLLGVLGYLVIGIVWLVSVFGGEQWRKISLFSLWGLLLFGTLFSIYLTFLEPFVIGATCAWCLTSAVVMTLLFWNSTASITQIGGKSNLKFIRQE